MANILHVTQQHLPAITSAKLIPELAFAALYTFSFTLNNSDIYQKIYNEMVVSMEDDLDHIFTNIFENNKSIIRRFNERTINISYNEYYQFYAKFMDEKYVVESNIKSFPESLKYNYSLNLARVFMSIIAICIIIYSNPPSHIPQGALANLINNSVFSFMVILLFIFYKPSIINVLCLLRLSLRKRKIIRAVKKISGLLREMRLHE